MADEMAPLIDTHLHIWDPHLFDMPWIVKAPSILNRAFTIEDYMAAVGDSPPQQAVYVEVDVATRDRSKELANVIEHLDDGTNVIRAAVIAADPGAADLEEWITRAQEIAGVRGFRTVLHNDNRPQGTCLDPNFVQGVQRIGEAGLHFELCMRMEELNDAAQLANAAPQTPLVLNHCGNPMLDGRDLSGWREGMARVGECGNVVCKVSGLLEHTKEGWSVEQIRSVIEHAHAAFGSERVLFGSNWPVCNLTASYARWHEVLAEVIASWPEEEQFALNFGNAARFYQLD